MANQSIDKIVTLLQAIHKIFEDKSGEVLDFYYWADEFFKGAALAHGVETIQESNRLDKVIERFQQLDQSILLEDAKALRERTLQKRRSVLDRLHAAKGLICKLSLVYVVGLFEAFFTDSVELVLNKGQLKNFKNLSFLKQVSYLQNAIGITIDESSVHVRMSDIDEVFARRNLLMHCGGRVDKPYLNRVGYSDFKEGDEVPVDEHYFTRAAYSFQELADYLYVALKAKVEGNYGTNS